MYIPIYLFLQRDVECVDLTTDRRTGLIIQRSPNEVINELRNVRTELILVIDFSFITTKKLLFSQNLVKTCCQLAKLKIS